MRSLIVLRNLPPLAPRNFRDLKFGGVFIDSASCHTSSLLFRQQTSTDAQAVVFLIAQSWDPYVSLDHPSDTNGSFYIHVYLDAEGSQPLGYLSPQSGDITAWNYGSDKVACNASDSSPFNIQFVGGAVHEYLWNDNFGVGPA